MKDKEKKKLESALWGLVVAATRYRSECQTSVPDTVLRHRRREEMFAALGKVDQVTKPEER